MSPRISLLLLVAALTIFLGYSAYVMSNNPGMQPAEALAKAAEQRIVLYTSSGLILATLVLTFLGLPSKQRGNSRAYVTIFVAGVLAMSPIFLDRSFQESLKLSVMQTLAITNSLVILGILTLIFVSASLTRTET